MISVMNNWTKVYPVKAKIKWPRNASPYTYGSEVAAWCQSHGLARFRDYDWKVARNKNRIWFVFKPEHQQIANMLLWKWAT